MCGFTGFYALKGNRSRTDLDSIVRNMSDTLTSRGPDHGDVWQDPDVAIALGHRRLSILDLSTSGHQPMRSTTDRYIIVFNGEIYNHLELRIKHLGDHDFRGHSDTETLLALIDELGLRNTLDAINGMFAFALWDRKERILHFARDRHGKKPIYIGWAGQNLVFGSELKALHAHPDFKGEIDKEALALYTRYNCVPAPHTIYQNVWQMTPGHMLSLDVGSLNSGAKLSGKMKCYWSAADSLKRSKPFEGSENDIIASFEAVLIDCVKDRLISDVPLGAFLSGGIDSSTVVALMQKISSKPVHTYTIGFKEVGFDEAVYARDVAKHLGTDHHEHYCSAQDALDVIPMLPDMYDEPFADQSAIPTYLVSKFARKDVTVALSGDGGDEMLGGYSRHVSGPKILNTMRPIPGFARKAMSAGINALSIEQWQALCPKKPLFGKHMHKAASILSMETQEDIYTRLTSQWESLPVLAHADAKFDESFLPRIEGVEFAEQIMLWDTMTYLPNDILTKVDRASMAVSLEARAPLLDRRIYDFVWGLPTDVKIRKGKGKWLLREVLSRHIPRNLFERPKQGFAMPIDQWLRHDLREWAEDLLDHKTIESQGLFDADMITRAWQSHLQGRGNYAEPLWNTLMFQAWHRRWQ
jgi:asparagine synthase (glutamine-hydrolysing)